MRQSHAVLIQRTMLLTRVKKFLRNVDAVAQGLIAKNPSLHYDKSLCDLIFQKKDRAKALAIAVAL